MTATEETAARLERPDERLAGAMHARVSALWQGYHDDRAAAVATLAQLRHRGQASEDISVAAWPLVASIVPDALAGHGDEPSRAEVASAVALSLFATHQQGHRDAPAHRRGADHSLGRSAAVLHRRRGTGGIERRVQALIRAQSFSSVHEHLRGLVTQVRDERIALDYAALVRDLYLAQHPRGMRRVRVRWSRDFYRHVSTPDDVDTLEPGADT